MLLPFFHVENLECGTDEAGRGCLAGPVTAAAILLPVNFRNEILTDSKQLNEATRFKLRPIIEEQAIAFWLTHIDASEIDSINILNASIKAMQQCIVRLNPKPKYIIVDGNTSINHIPLICPTTGNVLNKAKKFSINQDNFFNGIPYSCIVKGDSKYMSIAAASILAKTYRDDYMNTIHEEFPMYNWKKNKGYPTKEHREAIKKYGVTKYHRMSFKLLPEQLKLEI
ncbi:ribonuclease HII [Flavobacterium sp. PL11]|uniref:ribonuclease HII n=1 Tax=Flavobacterium sp. PL11 TaxID=3071717 RepID=UPI002E025FE3|nr:ribonuclease HII [Flavobacterium sp. PL11]